MLVGDSDNEERQKLVDRTRGVLFYSTPHLGTPSAGLWSNAKYLLLPSVEVQELKQGTSWSWSHVDASVVGLQPILGGTCLAY